MATSEHDTRAPENDTTGGLGQYPVTHRWRITGQRQGPQASVLEGTRRVASFPDYASAAQFVDRLSEADVDVTGIRIVGSDVRLVETVLGRLGWTRATLQGAAGGVPIGMLVGLFLGLFDPVAPLTSALFGLLFGALIGLVVGALLGAARRALRGRDGFASTTTLTAGRYDVLADPEVERSLARDAAPAADPRRP